MEAERLTLPRFPVRNDGCKKCKYPQLSLLFIALGKNPEHLGMTGFCEEGPFDQQPRMISVGTESCTLGKENRKYRGFEGRPA